MFLPTKLGAQSLNTSRPVHQGGHMRYNEEVLHELDGITDRHAERIDELIASLRQRVRLQTVPWR